MGKLPLGLVYAGPGHYLLILIDAHSEWTAASPTKSTSCHVTIELFHLLFAQFGLPDITVSDNDSFVSEEFQQFLKSNGIEQITLAPYHSSSNRLAKRAMQIVKKGLKRPLKDQ